ncbi:MAG: hypothetical protein JWM47_2743 [Acidimicrobiales bacterium]|nr:hypothetical protein [Acidimicrobiales bacterium]
MTITERDLRGIAGWFDRHDLGAFQAVTAVQHAAGATGDVLEIGAYKGRSTVVLRAGLAPGETLHVCDPFEDATGAPTNDSENQRSYATLSRQAFDANLARFDGPAPVIHQMISTGLAGRMAPGTFRLVHVDGSHLEDPVRFDLGLARELLQPGGVVICDDYRSPHTPGTALAVWEAVGAGLVPVLTTPMKLYGSWDPADDLVARLAAELQARGATTKWHKKNEGEELLHTMAGDPPWWRSPRALARKVLAGAR